MTYRMVLFDFDGTLCNTAAAVSGSIIAAYQQLGKPAPVLSIVEDTLAQGLRMEDMLKQFSPQEDLKTVHQILMKYRKIYLTEGEAYSCLFPQVQTLLAQLQAAGIIIAVVSNKLIDSLESALQRFQIAQYFSVVVGIQADGRAKPDPFIYEEYIQFAFPQISREQVLMVGDTAVDLQFAEAIPIDACWARYGHGLPEACAAFKPRYTINQLAELSAILNLSA